MFDKIILVTLKTRLEELIERFNTREQAKFYIEHMGLHFADYDGEHENYHRSLKQLRREIEVLVPKIQMIERSFLPNFIFGASDLVITLGRDGLVANTAKYLDGQPIFAVNPDPARIDGLLVPFATSGVTRGLQKVLENQASYHTITMAEVTLNDHQKMLAFNDFYIGQRTHLSSRYRLTWKKQTEPQSSSGVLVSTGVGSTGWLSSTQNMAYAVSRLLVPTQERLPRLTLSWEDRRLVFVVREPFESKASKIQMGAGILEEGEELILESTMPEGGVIFSDGIEKDTLEFNSGSVATIKAASKKTRLIAGETATKSQKGITIARK